MEAAFGLGLLRGMGSKYYYSSAGQEFSGHWWVTGRVMGKQYNISGPDDHNTQMLVAWGWNGMESHQMPRAPLVLYFKAEDKYTIVQTASNEFLIKTPIKDLENDLDPNQFWRVHRSAIVNIERIRIVKRSFTNQLMIGFDDTTLTIAVSRAYEHLFKQM